MLQLVRKFFEIEITMKPASSLYRNRSKARELALEYLYQWDLLDGAVCQSEQDFLNEKTENKNIKSFALFLIEGVIEHKPKIHEIISSVAKNWSLNRMIVIDRVILCLSIFELLYVDDIPPRVSINEAIELAKKYSTVKSFAFVNGILDQVAKKYPKSEK